MDLNHSFFERVNSEYSAFLLASAKEKQLYYSDLSHGYMSFGLRNLGYDCKSLKDCGDLLVDVQQILNDENFLFTTCFVVIACEKSTFASNFDEYVIDDFVSPTLYLYLDDFTSFSGDDLNFLKIFSEDDVVYYYVSRVIPEIGEADNFVLVTKGNFKDLPDLSYG
ncbi:hypothetical protein [Aliidiomarina soli]|uniref:Uncharacterized protein n=1 Tax=Aliidiomarina soli TaxID=1928574 RepID=A0A432WE71_9GAMM|nr:hypothetical protein [Aliidiomarina soli]RUO31155.1 hypothetical protein CWE14_11715 [Aliidiomarina soli]